MKLIMLACLAALSAGPATKVAKPGAPVALTVVSVSEATPGGEFRVQAQATTLRAYDGLVLSWEADEDVELAAGSQAPVQLPAGAGQAVHAVEAAGQWSGEGRGRIRLVAELQSGEAVTRRVLTIAVGQAHSPSEHLEEAAAPDGVRALPAEVTDTR